MIQSLYNLMALYKKNGCMQVWGSRSFSFFSIRVNLPLCNHLSQPAWQWGATPGARGLTLAETERRSKCSFVLCQERVIPDRFLGSSLKLSRGLIILPDPKSCCYRACLPLLFPFSPGHLTLGIQFFGVFFCTCLDQVPRRSSV